MALTFSCSKYGDRYLLSEALSVRCWGDSHAFYIFGIGVPGMLLFALVIPVELALLLMRQRKDLQLYPDQERYDPKWTLRLGFVYAGYKEGYEWWESVIMLRKCCFVLLSVYLRTYGVASQTVSASIVLVFALSLHLQNRPYSNDAHNFLESTGLHACLLQLLGALLCNLVGKQKLTNTLAPKSSIVLIVLVFGSALFFFYVTAVYTVKYSQDTVGCIGAISRCLKRSGCLVEHSCKKLESEDTNDYNDDGGKQEMVVAPTENEIQWGKFYETNPIEAANQGYTKLQYDKYQIKVMLWQREEQKQKQRKGENKWKKKIKKKKTKSVQIAPRSKLESELIEFKHRYAALKFRNSISGAISKTAKESRVKSSGLALKRIFTTVKSVEDVRLNKKVDEIEHNHYAHQRMRLTSIKRRQSSNHMNVIARVEARKRQKRVVALQKCKFFKHLDEGAILKILNAMKFKTYEKDVKIFKQGDVAFEFYIIAKGKVEVLIDNKHFAYLKELDVFGESGLVFNDDGLLSHRAATVQTVVSDNSNTPVQVFCLTKSKYIRIIEKCGHPPSGPPPSLEEKHCKELNL